MKNRCRALSSSWDWHPFRLPASIGSLLAVAMLAQCSVSAPAAEFSLAAEWVEGGSSVRIVVHSVPGKPVQLEASGDLVTWVGIQALENPTGTISYIDPDAPLSRVRFYRALTADQPPVIHVDPDAPAGGVYEIAGEFGDGPPGEFLVRFGGVDAAVVGRTPGGLRVLVPPDAVSGAVTVTGLDGSTFDAGRRVVTGPGIVKFQPPPGISPGSFRFINAYSLAPATATTLTVRRELPLLNMAVATDTNRPAFFLAISLSDLESMTLDAASTARALVFLSPLFYTPDPTRARAVLAAAEADPTVQALASRLESILLAGGDPMKDAAFEAAFEDALVSLLLGAGPEPAPGRIGRARLQDSDPVLEVDSVDLDYLRVQSRGTDVGVASAAINHLGWVVTVSRVDTDRAFPNGRTEFRAKVGEGIKPGQDEFPRVPGSARSFLVKSKLLFDNADLESVLFKLSGKIFNVSEDPVGRLDLPPDPALWVVRGVSPAWTPVPEADFVQAHYHAAYLSSVRVNLLAAAWDLLSAVSSIPLTSLVLEKFGDELEKSLSGLDVLPPVKSIGDFAQKAGQLSSVLATELSISALAADSAAGAEAAARASGLFARIQGWGGKLIGKALEGSGKVVNLSKAIERAIGVKVATPLESAFIEVGDPFQLVVLGVKPESGAVGDFIEVRIARQDFGKLATGDGVWFAGGDVPVPPEDVEPIDTADGDQLLKVKVPLLLGQRYDAAADKAAYAHLKLIVVSGGRRGSAPFEFLDHPTIASMDPAEGFAAAPDYLGGPFPGSAVTLRGSGFGPDDRFFFHQTESTAKGGAAGNVSVLVPAGAGSGLIQVVPDPPAPGNPGYSPAFKVLGPPVISRGGPASGPVGTTVRFSADNLGSGPASLALNGIPLSDVRLFPGEIAGVIPFGASSGSVRVVTPAGFAGSDFSVEPGLAAGALVQVGGDSVVSLQRALDLSAHTGAPLWTKGCGVSPGCIDDEDVELDLAGNPFRVLDPPEPGQVAEEGDFLTDNGIEAVPRFPVGKAFADTIVLTGTFPGNVVMGTNNLFDTVLSGGGEPSVIEGGLTILGSHNHLVNLHIRGRLVIQGDHNVLEGIYVTGSQNEGVVITGNENEVRVTCVSNTYDGLVIRGGQLNHVEVFSTANGKNGVTLTEGAFGNQVSVSTGFLSQPGGLIPWKGNVAHGIELLGAAAHNTIVGLSPIARNDADGIHLSGAGVSNNLITIFHAQANGTDGFSIRDGASSNRFGAIVAESNGGNGIVVRGGPGTSFQNVRSGFNHRCGVQLIGVSNLVGALVLQAQGNWAAALRLEGGTHGVVAKGSSTQDGLGVELLDDGTSRNDLALFIDAPFMDGAVLRGANRNTLALQIRNGKSNGLLVEAGANWNEFPQLQVNNCAMAGVILRGAGTFVNRFPDPRIGLPIQGEPAGNGSDGVIIDLGATNNRIGDPDGRGPDIRDNGGVGIRVRGATTLGNEILHASILEQANVGRVQQAGLVLEAGVSHMTVRDASITGHAGPGIEIHQSPSNDVGATAAGNAGNHIARNQIGVKLTGAGTAACRVYGNTIVENGMGVLIDDGATGNEIGARNILGDGITGLRVDGATGNLIRENFVRDNLGIGISLLNGASGNLVQSNTIVRNATGVEVAGAQSLGNRLTVNSISANTGKGIRLRTGGNRELQAPSITGIGSQRIAGTAFVDDGGRIELFSDPADEGAELLGSGIVVNGSWVVPVHLRAGDVGRKFRLHATVTDSKEDTSEFGDTESSGGISPVAFVSTRDGNREVYLLSGMGSDAVRLTIHPAQDYSPALAPGAGSLVFVSDRDGNPDLYRMTLVGTNPVARLTTAPAADYDPVWRPDGNKLAFVSERDGNPEIYLSNPDGTDSVRITTDDGSDRWPTFSPDGSRIAFASNRGGNWDLWIMNADGSNPQPLVTHPSDDTQPAWSPDGNAIAFVSGRDGNPEIYLVRPDGTDLRRLTQNPSADVDPGWLPGGGAVLFSSARDAGFEIYEVGIAGGSPGRLTVSLGDNTQPNASR